jgi:hypothetical protein
MHETDIQKKLEAISKNETDIQKKSRKFQWFIIAINFRLHGNFLCLQCHYEFSGQAFTLAGAFSYHLTLAADEWRVESFFVRFRFVLRILRTGIYPDRGFFLTNLLWQQKNGHPKKMISLLLSKNLNLFYIVHVFEKD